MTISPPGTFPKLSAAQGPLLFPSVRKKTSLSHSLLLSFMQLENREL